MVAAHHAQLEPGKLGGLIGALAMAMLGSGSA